MYAYFKGIVTEREENQIVLEVNNIGYNILCTASLLSMLPPKGEEIKVYTFTSVREDAFTLLGFASKEELKLFRMLITVSGIGPKGGLSMLSAMRPDEIKLAILTGDAKKLAKAPGIGIKSAEHCISDLKKKISEEGILAYASDDEIEDATEQGTEDAKEACEALVVLGYTNAEAKKAVQSAVKDGVVGTENLLSASLKYLYR